MWLENNNAGEIVRELKRMSKEKKVYLTEKDIYNLVYK